MKAYMCSAVSLAILALVVCVAGNAFATTLSVDATPATAGTVDIRQTLQDDGSDMVRRDNSVSDPLTHQWFGQTFTVPAGGMSVDKIGYMFQQEVAADRNTSGMTMGVIVYNLDGANIMNGSVISSQSAVTPAFLQGANLWMNFDVDNFILPAGQYGINFDFAFAASIGALPPGGHKISNAGMHFISNGIDNYTGGQGWRTTNNTTNTLTGAGEPRDLPFYVTGGVIPEPSTSVLAGFGLVAVMGWVRRQRGRK